MESITIREVTESIESGLIRIPAFQRGFVWEPERIAQFMDTIYKGYPFGALLFWRAGEKLRSENKLGPFELPPPKVDFPIDYVLDGQQRVTSVYLTFKSSEGLELGPDWKEIYFDHSLPDEAQEPQFFALDAGEVDPNRHFPVRVIFDTVAYRKATLTLDDTLATRIDNMQAKFKEARMPVQIFRTEDKGTVAVIFERINRQGVPLDTLQLLSAWTWSEDFQLKKQFSELVEELEEKGFNAGLLDENLVLRCASAILVANPRPEAIVAISGEKIRERFDEVTNGILGALDFLEMNLNVRRIDNLPFQTILVPLSVFFAVSGTKQLTVTGDQREKILKWFWRVSFAKRYSSGVIRHLEEDIKAMLQLKGGQQSNLGEFTVEIDEIFFVANDFSIRNVSTKTFVLMLAQQHPLSFVSGSPVNLNEKLKEYNNAEFHHMMPKAFVRDSGQATELTNCLSNFCFLSRSENKTLGGIAPSRYRQHMPANIDAILEKAICPTSLFEDEIEQFIHQRSNMLAMVARALID